LVRIDLQPDTTYLDPQTESGPPWPNSATYDPMKTSHILVMDDSIKFDRICTRLTLLNLVGYWLTKT